MNDRQATGATSAARDACGCAVRRQTVADYVADARHGGSLEGATAVGEAVGSLYLMVRVGLWQDPAGRVMQARFKATTCAPLIAYAEVACDLVEAIADPTAVGADALRAHVSGVHPLHRDRAELVAAALRSALSHSPHPGGLP